jgi:hypothetical protein
MLQQVVRIVTTSQSEVQTPSLGNAVPNCPLTDTSINLAVTYRNGKYRLSFQAWPSGCVRRELWQELPVTCCSYMYSRTLRGREGDTL